jgi:hypothetical protein
MGWRPPFIVLGGNLLVGVSDHQTSQVVDQTSLVNSSGNRSRPDRLGPSDKSGGGPD